MTTATYILATVTGSDLIDACGRATGPEISRVHSKHRTLRGAHGAQRKARGWVSCPVILNADRTRLSESDRAALDAMHLGA